VTVAADIMESRTEAGAGVSLRPITASDEAFLRRLYASTRAAEMAVVPWSEEQKDAFLRMQFDAQHRFYRSRYGRARFDVIEKDGEPIGRLYVDRGENEIRIVDVALLPEHRGRGIGSARMREILDEARTEGKRVVIHVERENPAHRWYVRLGFRVVEDLGIYFRMEWTSEKEA
jgi:GNAT superfamily N-acetyltransferase